MQQRQTAHGAIGHTPARRLKMLMAPDWRSGNPYQQLLADAVAKHGIDVVFPISKPRLLPIFRVARGLKVDVVSIHWLDEYWTHPSIVASVILAVRTVLDLSLVRATGIPIVWTVHNMIAHESRSPYLELLLYRMVAKLASRVLVHQNCSVETVGRAYRVTREKFSVVPFGNYRGVYGESCPMGQARRALQLPGTGKIYLHQGLLRPYKGLEQLVSAWIEAEMGSKGHTLLIAGKAKENAYEREIASRIRDVDGILFRPGFIQPDDMHLYFSAADVVVLPFTRILNSGSLVLAMSYGKAVIAPRVNTIQEVLGHADDLLYDYADPRGLSGALYRSLNADLSSLSERVTTACDALDRSKNAGLFANVARSVVKAS